MANRSNRGVERIGSNGGRPWPDKGENCTLISRCELLNTIVVRCTMEFLCFFIGSFVQRNTENISSVALVVNRFFVRKQARSSRD